MNNHISLNKLGYNQTFENFRQQQGLDAFEVGRVILEHKERYVVKTEDGEYDGEIIGNLRYTAQSRADFPAVGDWVAISPYDIDKVLIHAIFNRTSTLKRRAVGKQGEAQIIATNIDFAFLVQSVNRDFNLNRLERYLAICNDAGVEPIIVLTKVDLIPAATIKEMLEKVEQRIPEVKAFAISNETGIGLEQLKNQIIPGKTYCVLGSSGVGKSSLINNIIGGDYLKTGEIGQQTNRGKHVTSHRELIVLEDGGIIIDTPGMREIGLTDLSDGLSLTFDQITELSKQCKFNDCTHQHEVGCAVLEALEEGHIELEMYNNYLKLIREQTHYEESVAEKRRRGKAFSKMVKATIKNKRKLK